MSLISPLPCGARPRFSQQSAHHHLHTKTIEQGFLNNPSILLNLRWKFTIFGMPSHRKKNWFVGQLSWTREGAISMQAFLGQ